MTVSDSFIYALGRKVLPLSFPYSGVDITYASERHDQIEIQFADYKHCSFINMGFKKSAFKNSHFLNCIFIDCYFRRAEFKNCTFTGCKFINCDFEHVNLICCDFRYSRFSNCYINYQQMNYNLPREPNLCEEISRNLYLECSNLGLSKQAKLYRTIELKSHEKHLKAAVLHSSQWYAEHFNGLRRVIALISLIGSTINFWLWGYGQQMRKLVFHALILPLIIFPLIYMVFVDHLAHQTKEVINIIDLIPFSIVTFLPIGSSSIIDSPYIWVQVIFGLESLLGVIITALFTAYLFHWILHR